MDSNLMSCPKCGHTVSNAAGTCAYCGAIISEGEHKKQTDDNLEIEEIQSTEPPPLQPVEMNPAAEMSHEADIAQAAAEISTESIVWQPTPAEADAVASSDPASAAEHLADIAAAEGKTETGVVGPEEEQAVTPDPETARQAPDSRSDPEIELTTAALPEAAALSEPEPPVDLSQEYDAPAIEKDHLGGITHQTIEAHAQAESGAEKDPMSPEPEVLDLAAEEPEESEILGAEIVEMLETRASEDNAERSADSDERLSSNKAIDTASNDQQDDRQPPETQKAADEKKVGLISEALEDTILLESAYEVKTPAEAPSEQVEEKAKMSAPKARGPAKAGSDDAAAGYKMASDVLKIEKAAQDMAAAVKKQKEKLGEVADLTAKKAEAAKMQALKNQKAALAKAQAKKKQKLLLAKAAALKRKKAAEAKAQALKQQKEAQAGIEALETQEAAARPANTIARSPEVNSKMQDLLKKYKGQAIGINYDNSAEIREAQLVEANSEYFSVFVKDKKLHYNYPLKTILTVIEGKDGVDTGSSKQPIKFNAVIKVYPLVLF
jgi:hypothetical protein